MQRVNRNRIKLLVTLVLFTLAVTSAWPSSQADARGLKSPSASSHFVTTRPGASLASGDPDAGQNCTPPPPPTTKQQSWLPVGWEARGTTLIDWARWTGRIWATLNLRAR